MKKQNFLVGNEEIEEQVSTLDEPSTAGSVFYHKMHEVFTYATTMVDMNENPEAFNTLVDAGVRLQNTLIMEDLKWAEFNSRQAYYNEQKNNKLQKQEDTKTQKTPSQRIIEALTNAHIKAVAKGSTRNAGLTKGYLAKDGITQEDVEKFITQNEDSILPRATPDQKFELVLMINGEWLNVSPLNTE